MNRDKSTSSIVKQESSPLTPFAERQPTGFQFSMGSLLIIMAIVSVMSACLLWASRLPLVTNEIHVWLGTTPAANDDGTDRGAQLIFLLFCYSAPLLMAALIHSSLLLIRLLQPQFQSAEEVDEEF